MKPTPEERVRHIAKAIDKIERAVSGHTLPTFRDDELLTAAVETWLGNISEASRYISADLKMNSPEISWRRLADLGNWLRHAYHSTDAGLMWVMIEENLPPLKVVIQRELAKYDR